MQSLWLIVVVFFLVLMIMPIFIKLHASFDFLHNIGIISVYVFFIKVFCYKVRIGKGGLILFTKKDEKDIPIELSAGKMRFLEQLFVQIKQKVIIKNIKVFSNIGVTDAMNSALINGVISIMVQSMFAIIKNTKKSAKFVHYNNVAYNDTKFTIAIVGKLFITIFDIIYSLSLSLIIIKRSEKYEGV